MGQTKEAKKMQNRIDEFGNKELRNELRLFRRRASSFASYCWIRSKVEEMSYLWPSAKRLLYDAEHITSDAERDEIKNLIASRLLLLEKEIIQRQLPLPRWQRPEWLNEYKGG